MSDQKLVTLETLRQGEFIDMVNEAIAEVSADLVDPEKKAGSTRSVTLKIDFIPNTQSQNQVGIVGEVVTKLAKAEGRASVGWVRMDSSGKVSLMSIDMNQRELFNAGEEGDDAEAVVVPIQSAAGGAGGDE